MFVFVHILSTKNARMSPIISTCAANFFERSLLGCSIFAELELGMIRERVKSGMANAKAKGVCIGRPQLTRDKIPPIFYRHYPAYVNGELNISELARVCDVSRTTVYKYIEILK